VLQNSLKSPFLPSQILCNLLENFPQIFLPLESIYSISNPILIQISIKIDFLFLFWISARAMVSARPPPFFSSPAAGHLLPPFPAQSARHLPLTDRWAHPVIEPGCLLPPEARPGATAGSSPPCSTPSFPTAKRIGAAALFLSPTPGFPSPFPPLPETASPLKLHRAAAGYSSTAHLRSFPGP
jgi:hypothetical protein